NAPPTFPAVDMRDRGPGPGGPRRSTGGPGAAVLDVSAACNLLPQRFGAVDSGEYVLHEFLQHRQRLLIVFAATRPEETLSHTSLDDDVGPTMVGTEHGAVPHVPADTLPILRCAPVFAD